MKFLIPLHSTANTNWTFFLVYPGVTRAKVIDSSSSSGLVSGPGYRANSATNVDRNTIINRDVDISWYEYVQIFISMCLPIYYIHVCMYNTSSRIAEQSDTIGPITNPVSIRNFASRPIHKSSLTYIVLSLLFLRFFHFYFSRIFNHTY